MSATLVERLLVVDDELELKEALCESLSEHGFHVTGASSGQEALACLAENQYDLVISDLMMPGMSGIELLRAIRQDQPNLLFIIMTGQGTIQSAVEAMKLGAFDYLLKPFSLQLLLPLVNRSLETRRLRQENRQLREHISRLTFQSPRFQLVGSSAAMQPILRLIEKVAPTDASVLIQGESGTGKELVARALHQNSPRVAQPLVTINCAALQESLVESELFGHEKGAFTGANQAKPGLIEVAEGGTLFIDEVAEMSLAMQAKLLRVLEDGHYRRVGSVKDCHADVRIIAATNKPLRQEQQAGRFREDLFYRLNVIAIELPPLRARREDIPRLVEHFLRTRAKGAQAATLAPEAMTALQKYHWPGNVRELANVLERAEILCEERHITLDDLPELLFAPVAGFGAPVAHVEPGADSQSSTVEELTGTTDLSLNILEHERRLVKQAIEAANGNKAQAARLLGITRRTLYRLLERYGLDLDNQ